MLTCFSRTNHGSTEKSIRKCQFKCSEIFLSTDLYPPSIAYINCRASEPLKNLAMNVDCATVPELALAAKPQRNPAETRGYEYLEAVRTVIQRKVLDGNKTYQIFYQTGVLWNLDTFARTGLSDLMSSHRLGAPFSCFPKHLSYCLLWYVRFIRQLLAIIREGDIS